MEYDTNFWSGLVMIKKLHNLKKTQLDQKIILKQQVLNMIDSIDAEIFEINKKLSQTGVEKFGAIGDFQILEIHKNSMRFEKRKKEKQKFNLENQLKTFNLGIIEFQKEVEKYKYLLKMELKEKIKKQMKYDEEIASEFVQAKYSQSMRQR